MSKHDTQYSEGERELTKTHLSRFGLNPYALDILINSYIKFVAPYPTTLDYFVDMDDARCQVEFEIRKPGYVGNRKGDAHKLDEYALRLFCRSYFENTGPWPVSFLYKGMEVHVRTPGVSDSDRKNIARNIYNPT